MTWSQAFKKWAVEALGVSIGGARELSIDPDAYERSKKAFRAGWRAAERAITGALRDAPRPPTDGGEPIEY